MATQRLFRTLADAPHVVKLLTGSPTGYVPSAELLRFLAALEALHGLKAPAVADVRLPAIDSDALKATIAKKQQMESDSELLQTEVGEGPGRGEAALAGPCVRCVMAGSDVPQPPCMPACAISCPVFTV